ncbi:multidrug MFS transporter [Haematobacter missouriensis]|uniref:Bcr/CflA family efflux transporter n=1 Tax=Haematobacter missouriensis TaxID=366616 RepID=A0A212AYT5_9RHOB|nr:multidrug effflux MFS transporter [Haematobacter missouriensis]KFI25531.1 multidrug MFS transporter [Haematobacter missouriensis]OWJ75521.1 multidrug MFS transporter [Haematobacter missouriensis]OWJ86628.1 multidrug MFS transporter [Haematobacter missouriensis]
MAGSLLSTQRRGGLFNPRAQPPFGEFVALIAMMFATIALSIDAMLPALPQIAHELDLANPNRAQIIIPVFMAGIGLGQLFAGPLSDSFGRRRIIVIGVAIYIMGSLTAYLSHSFELLLVARFLQGIGASAPRIVGVAIVRDRYEGRMMARVMSFVMTLFILVPAIAPLFGTFVIHLAGWRSIFLVLVFAGVVMALWLLSRQPETLEVNHRRPFSFRAIGGAMREIFGNRLVVVYLLAMTLGFGPLFGFISSVQQIYDVSFGMGESFALWFAAQALIAGTAGPINATLVMRFGMRRMASTAFLIQAVLSVVMFTLWRIGVFESHPFPAFFCWAAAVFFLNGFIFGNLNALSLEHLGHIAGSAASVIGAVSTVLAVLIAFPIGQAFDGTPMPLIFGITCCACAGYLLMLYSRKHG